MHRLETASFSGVRSADVEWTLWGVHWDGTFAAAVVAGVIALITLAWTITSCLIGRSDARSLSHEQIEASKANVKAELDARIPLDNRAQFLERFKWGLQLVRSKNSTERFTGAVLLKDLTLDPFVTVKDQQLALSVVTKLGPGGA
ncbi:hypothetical protein ASE16_03180 [Leifsonia sp. Root227]|uniref:hypothetical protein n=1 Tax=Leifsonia sp. Root227 TaxID=1736496 RepID=UPI0006F2A63A|nr:hypothetical protein [Leifsonia sp. Root227]KRC52074.1 hypothetical protein ASE16_03180 [Leifsonia sp. Root227]